MSQTCNSCIWWHPNDATREQGACRRREPRLVLSRQSDARSAVWPPVAADAWCGEYRHNPNTPQPEGRADV
ncbi:hypothetical protein AncyloWKF20_05320 [Ancylobacter sp. WKF20]|uniref:hypothetical protein n=1 Tax=Ancylobacter sp. WKF20 TaxID=3039801 RepID=UPI0024341E0A|nr:hypothetical protein [Ancylobacter sp. WKF20]WGD31245.1 hypothetical protein AncyloWKF20_05320 [Ancylobacter sp. WKF20]